MAEKKKLKVSAMSADLRDVKEETLRQYESVSIEAMNIYVTERSAELLHRYPVQMEAMNVIKLKEDEEILKQNGTFVIRPGEESEKKVYLIVNGKLLVEKGSGEALKSYSGIQVNGSVLYPQSVEKVLFPILRVNGSVHSYPDDENTVFMDTTTMIDRAFLARARENSRYYVEGKAVFMDEKADYGKLSAKNVTITASHALMTESALDAAGQNLDEKAKVELVPDGCVYVKEEQELDDSFVRRFGTKVYVAGNLRVLCPDEISKLEYLKVAGTAIVKEQDKAAFLSVCSGYGKLVSYRGGLIMDRKSVTIDRAMLLAEESLVVTDCIDVKIAEDVDGQLVRDRLQISDCKSVECSPELVGIVSLLAKDCLDISARKGMQEENPEEKDTVFVEAMNYKM